MRSEYGELELVPDEEFLEFRPREIQDNQLGKLQLILDERVSLTERRSGPVAVCGRCDPPALPVRADIVPNLSINGGFRLNPPFRLCDIGPAEPPDRETGRNAKKSAPDV